MDVVFGITGQTGSATAATLLAAGRSVRALVRDPERASAWRDRGVELVQGDLHDAASVRGVLQGADSAYVLLPPQWGVPDLFAANEPVVEALVSGVEQAEVPRVVLLSSIGADRPEGTGPIRTVRPLEAAWADRPGVTFLRAAYFQENHGSALAPAANDGVLPSFFDPHRPLAMVATADIGAEAGRLLQQSPDGAPRVVNLAGPEDYTLDDVARELTTLLGRDVVPHRLPAEAITGVLESQGAGHYATLYAELNRGIDEGHLTFVGPVTRGPTPLSTTLSELVRRA